MLRVASPVLATRKACQRYRTRKKADRPLRTAASSKVIMRPSASACAISEFEALAPVLLLCLCLRAAHAAVRPANFELEAEFCGAPCTALAFGCNCSPWPPGWPGWPGLPGPWSRAETSGNVTKAIAQSKLLEPGVLRPKLENGRCRDQGFQSSAALYTA